MGTRTLMVAGLVFGCVLTACTGRTPDVLHVGRSLVATITVVAEVAPDVGWDGASGLEVEVLDVHWIGHPAPAVLETPEVQTGERLLVLRPPKHDYQVGETYVASFDYGPEGFGYQWWTNTGVDSDGGVVQGRLKKGVAEEALTVADEADGDRDSAADLLSSLAAEWEAFLNARDARGSEEGLPLGPMLKAMYRAAGVEIDATVSVESVAEEYLARPANQRVLPTELAEDLQFAALIEGSLGVDLVQMEGLVLHDDRVEEGSTIALWFEEVGRTAESFVDSATGVTVLRTTVPARLSFELVAFSHNLVPAPGEPRLWDLNLGSVDGPEFDLRPGSPAETMYLVVDIRGSTPQALVLDEADYLELIAKMEGVLNRGDGGVGGELGE